MTRLFSLLTAMAVWISLGAQAQARDLLRTPCGAALHSQWTFVADTVMGGVSSGGVSWETNGDAGFARLAGSVSTENRGGFIQFRRDLPYVLPASARGVRLVVRGNGERYFIHLRTRGLVVPWQYFQAGFATSAHWREVRLPLSEFTASGSLMRPTPAASSITSIGVVAYGRDHQARIDVREIGFY